LTFSSLQCFGVFKNFFPASLIIPQNAVELSNFACATAELKVKKQSWEKGVKRKKEKKKKE